MAEVISVGQIIKTSVVTGFTIAAALIWKEFISELMSVIIPSQEVLYAHLLSAVVATGIIVLMIYVVLKTESEAELIFDKIVNHKKKEEIKLEDHSLRDLKKVEKVVKQEVRQRQKR